MGPKRSNEELVQAIADRLDEELLSADYPLDEVEKELREAGADPKQIAAWGNRLVEDLAKKRRLAWQDDARLTRDAMRARLAQRKPVAMMPRNDLLERIEAARKDPRLGGELATAARNLVQNKMTSDEALRQLLEDLESLAILSDDDDGKGTAR